jgi:hypothetical protein
MLPILKVVLGVKMDTLSDCEPAAKQDPRVDLQNCIEYYRDLQSQTLRRFVRYAARAIVPPLALLLFVAAVGSGFAGFPARAKPHPV